MAIAAKVSFGGMTGAVQNKKQGGVGSLASTPVFKKLDLISKTLLEIKQIMQKGAPTGGAQVFNQFKKSLSETISKTALAQDAPIWGDIAAGIGGIVLAARGIYDVASSIFKKLVEASPHLQATMTVLNKTVEVTLRPIADTISMFLRPFLISWLRIVLPIYRSWKAWMDEGGGLQARVTLGEGWEQIKEGIFEIDFEKIFSGFETVWEGVKQLFGSFGEEVLGSQLDGFYAWWEKAQKKFETSGVFDTLWAILKEGFWESVEYLMKQFGLIDERQEIDDFGQALKAIVGDSVYEALTDIWEAFGEYLENLGDVWWLGPLAPFGAAMITLWERAVPSMIDTLITELKNKWGQWSYSTFGTGDPRIWNRPMTGSEQEAVSEYYAELREARNSNGSLKSMLGMASGGVMPGDGWRYLHQGETVIPKHDTRSMNFNPNITVNANVTSNMDIQQLADQIANLTYDGLRRRVSYYTLR